MLNACRICMEENVLTSMKVICLQTQKLTYVKVFHICTSLQAQPEDKLCKICAEELKEFYAFICKARETDVKLKQNTSTVLQTPTSDDALPMEFICTNEYDPLIDSADENDDKTEDLELNWSETTQPNAITDDLDSDDEDNKPLKEIIHGTKTAVPKLEVDGNEKTVGDAKTYAEREEEYEYDDNSTGNVPDFAMSAEVQIFPQGRFKCRTCGKNYFTTIGLEAHLEVHLPKNALTKKKRIRGPNKKKKNADADDFSATEEETQHNLKTAEDDASECLENGNEILSTSAKVGGRKPRQQKLPKPKKMFPCHVCGKHMISASKLRYHMVMHTGEKDYLCTMCPKAYSTIYALKHHLRTHTGERPYECKFCGDKFLRPTTLKSHMRRHTGERPYGCDQCGKRFIQHSSMTTHMKLNHMAKTIPCPHCDKKYARQTDLNTHLLSHTGNKPFSCQLCPSRFIRQANLNKHMNQQHSGTKSNVSKPIKTKPSNRKHETKVITATSANATIPNEYSENSASHNINVVATPTPNLVEATNNIEQLNKINSSNTNVSLAETNQTHLLPSLFTADANATTSRRFTQFDMVNSNNQLQQESSSKQQSPLLHLYNWNWQHNQQS